jgi:hypothetical protein
MDQPMVTTKALVWDCLMRTSVVPLGPVTAPTMAKNWGSDSDDLQGNWEVCWDCRSAYSMVMHWVRALDSQPYMMAPTMDSHSGMSMVPLTAEVWDLKRDT